MILQMDSMNSHRLDFAVGGFENLDFCVANRQTLPFFGDRADMVKDVTGNRFVVVQYVENDVTPMITVVQNWIKEFN